MQKINVREVLLACVAGSVTVLAACGPHADAPPAAAPSAVTLTAKSDVQRELGVAGGLVTNFGPSGAGASPAMAMAMPAGRVAAKTGMFRIPAGFVVRQPKAAVAPKAAQTVQCTGGGTSTGDSGAKTRSFQFFGIAEAVNWSSSTDSNCSALFTNQDGSSTTYTSNGTEEDGSSSNTSASDQYVYVLLGSGSTPVSFSGTDKDASQTTTNQWTSNVLGTIEDLSTSALVDTRAALSVDASGTSGGQTYTGSIVFGTGSEYLKVTMDPNGTTTLDGPLSYSTNVPGCPGGAEELATLQPITVDANGYPTGGVLKISSGGKSVTVTFNSDGSASLAFSDGSSSSMTASEVQNSLLASCDDVTAPR